MDTADTVRKWLRRTFPRLYARFGRYFHTHYALQCRIVRHARRHPGEYADPGLAAAVTALSRGGISVFSFPGREKYDTLAVEVHVDDEGFPWVDHGGRRLYFRRGTTSAQVAALYRRLLEEQDPASPHCYRAGGGEAREGDVLLDVGSAEGIWALEGVERASSVILFEVEPAWAAALERTFAPWRDKVKIINKFASDVDDGHSVSLDTVVRELSGPLLLKIDVEGAEERVLEGAREALARLDTRAVICTYHRGGDHGKLSDVMRTQGYDVATSGGWMLFVHDRNLQPPFFRRGLIYCRK